MKLKNIVAWCFFAAVALSFISPVNDVDFPWHLKTGEYIYQHGEIPKTDPFTLAPTGNARERFILSQYWLGQLIYYFIYKGVGLLGIIALRSMLITGIIIILWFAMKSTPLPVKAFILYLTSQMFLLYIGDRPQLFSFFFAAVIIALLENFRREGGLLYSLSLPLVMCFWANVHGGYIFGDVAIAVVCFTETVKYLFFRKSMQPLEQGRLWPFLSVCLISILLSFLNPNNFDAFIMVFGSRSSFLQAAVREYMSPISEIRSPFAKPGHFIYWAIMGYSLVLLAINLRRVDLTHLGLIFFTLCLSLSATRFVPFFVISALIIGAQYRFNIVDFEKIAIANKLRLPAAVGCLTLVLSWGVSLAHSLPAKDSLSAMVSPSLFPEKACLFLLEKVDAREGRICNSYNIGSYLLWRLYPHYRVFLDSRGINYEAIRDWQSIESAERWAGDDYSLLNSLNDILPANGKIILKFQGPRQANPPGKERWSSLLDKYNIDFIVHEATNFFDGDIVPLVLRLVRDDRWKLIYTGGDVLIFVRDVPKYKDIIARYGMDKRGVYDEIGMEDVKRIGKPSAKVYSSIAFALLMKGGADTEVDKYIKHALSFDPNDSTAIYLEAYLKIKRQKG